MERTSPQETSVQQVARMSSGFANLVYRFLALVVDTLLIFSPLWALYLLGFAPSAGNYTSPHPLLGTLLVVYAVLLIAYKPVCEAQFGGTAGKYVLGLRIVNRDGAFPSGSQVGLRWLADIIGGFFYIGPLIAAIAILCTPYHQRVGDKWADTYVVRKADLDTMKGHVIEV